MPVANDIYYHIYEDPAPGEKLPLVLIHGAGGSHLSWPSEVRRMTSFRVYALDLPGHGKSQGRGLQSIPAYSEVLLDWMEAAGLYQAIFTGHSMGSAVAIHLALEHPERITGLGLVGAAARLRVNPQILEGTRSSTTFHSAVAAVTGWSFSPQADARLVELAERRMAEVRPSVLHADFLACDSFDETGRLGSITCPTLVICGEDDRMTPRRSAQFLADSIPNAQMAAIPGAGHMVMLEQPQVVANALRDFFLPRL